MSSHRFRIAVASMFALVAIALAAIATAEPLSTAFTYQGEIGQSGSPLNGSADFQFSLHDALAGGAQVGSTLSLNGVIVTDGVFAALLDFGVDVFNGEARYLQIAVRAPAGSGSFTTLSPRVNVTPTPYSLQTRGIFVDSFENVTIGSASPPAASLRAPHQVMSPPADKLKVWAHGPGDVAVDGESDATSGASDGVHGKSASSEGRGMFGEAIATTGDAKGVHGKSASDHGAGMMGEATSTSGDAKGVHGKSAAADGAGILGEATGGANAHGVEGKSTSGTGVHGEGATGMHGKSDTADGKGIVGEATNGSNAHGVEGKSTNGEGLHGEGNIGVRGKANSPTGLAGYFEGWAYVSDRIGVGTLTPAAKLDIAGTPGSDGIRFPDGTVQTTATPASASFWSASGSDITYAGGSVGVGTSTPAGKLAALAAGNAIGLLGQSPVGTGVKGEGTSGGVGVLGVSPANAVVGNSTGNGVTFGVFGTSASTSLGAAGVRGEGPAGVMGVSGSVAGGVGVHGTSLAPSGIGVQGDGASNTGVLGAGATVGVKGTTVGTIGGGYGVHGVSTSTSFQSAGVLAEGNSTESSGVLRAVALDIRNGAVAVSGAVRPAGTITVNPGSATWTALTSCNALAGPNTHSHTIGHVTQVTLSNPLITSTSLVLLTVSHTGSSPLDAAYVATVRGVVGGGLVTIDLVRLGVQTPSTCDTPTGSVAINYLIVSNP